MKKLIAFLLLISILFNKGFAQSASVSGTISDTSEKKIIANSSVLILRKADSILVGFSRTDKQGNFSIKNLPAGKFIILITYPKYADYTDTLAITDSTETKLGNISLIQKAQLLKEVIFRQQVSAIKIKGDTTEYKADSFRVQPNATVEDLLKKLPGIQVDKNGAITAQGEICKSGR